MPKIFWIDYLIIYIIMIPTTIQFIMSKSIIEQNLDKLTNIFETSNLSDDNRLDILKQINAIKKMLDEVDETTRKSILASKALAQYAEELLKKTLLDIQETLKKENEDKRIEDIKKIFDKMENLINKIKDEHKIINESDTDLLSSYNLFQNELNKPTKSDEKIEPNKGLKPSF